MSIEINGITYSGSGTSADPYIVNNWTEFINISGYFSDGSGKYIAFNPDASNKIIDMNNETGGESVTGILVTSNIIGNGWTIFNLVVSSYVLSIRSNGIDGSPITITNLNLLNVLHKSTGDFIEVTSVTCTFTRCCITGLSGVSNTNIIYSNTAQLAFKQCVINIRHNLKSRLTFSYATSVSNKVNITNCNIRITKTYKYDHGGIGLFYYTELRDSRIDINIINTTPNDPNSTQVMFGKGDQYTTGSLPLSGCIITVRIPDGIKLNMNPINSSFAADPTILGNMSGFTITNTTTDSRRIDVTEEQLRDPKYLESTGFPIIIPTTS